MTEKSFLGSYGEKLAANYLRRRGYTVMERNYRAGHKEIDLIVKRFRTITFVEVKTRTYRTEEDCLFSPPPGSAVDEEKIRLTRSAARQYLYERHSKAIPQMDVMEVWLAPAENGKKPKVRKIHHIPGAY